MTNRMATAAILALTLSSLAGSGLAMEGRAWGDIHVQTLDGATYDFQAAGEARTRLTQRFEDEIAIAPAE